MTTYSICYQYRRDLRGILDRLGGSEQEYAAIERLHGFRGTREDVETAARIYELAGEHANAAALRRGCYGADEHGEDDARR